MDISPIDQVSIYRRKQKRQNSLTEKNQWHAVKSRWHKKKKTRRARREKCGQPEGLAHSSNTKVKQLRIAMSTHRVESSSSQRDDIHSSISSISLFCVRPTKSPKSTSSEAVKGAGQETDWGIPSTLGLMHAKYIIYILSIVKKKLDIQLNDLWFFRSALLFVSKFFGYWIGPVWLT